MRKTHKVSREVKEQIINRIKTEGITLLEASKDHGVAPSTISGWLAKKVSGGITLTQYAKLRRENEDLKRLLGELTLEKTRAQKKN
jgi:transposase-like protein